METLSNGALPLGRGGQGRKTSKGEGMLWRGEEARNLWIFTGADSAWKDVVGKIKKYDQCPQLADGEIVTLLDGGVNDGYYCSGGALCVPKRLIV